MQPIEILYQIEVYQNNSWFAYGNPHPSIENAVSAVQILLSLIIALVRFQFPVPFDINLSLEEI